MVFIVESSHGKRVVALKTRDAAVKAAGHYLNQLQREGVLAKRISGDGARELGRSGKCSRKLAERGVRWWSSDSCTPQSAGIAQSGLKQITVEARCQLLTSRCVEQLWSFTVIDTALKLAGAPQKYLCEETPHEGLSGKPFTHVRLCPWKSDCDIH